MRIKVFLIINTSLILSTNIYWVLPIYWACSKMFRTLSLCTVLWKNSGLNKEQTIVYQCYLWPLIDQISMIRTTVWSFSTRGNRSLCNVKGKNFRKSHIGRVLNDAGNRNKKWQFTLPETESRCYRAVAEWTQERKLQRQKGRTLPLLTAPLVISLLGTLRV